MFIQIKVQLDIWDDESVVIHMSVWCCGLFLSLFPVCVLG
jgi:hypothetical protein